MAPAMKPDNPWQRAFLFIGSLGPLGYLPASGTVTVALLGPVLYWLMHSLSFQTYIAITLGFTGISVWVHSVGDRLLGEKDSRRLVWDELVGFLFALAWVHTFTWQIAVVAVLIERVIDILKVPPANWIEDHWPGGWGVVGDDVVAGIYTCALIHVLMRVVPTWCGLGG